VQELVRFWGTDYNWRKIESRLNALPQFIIEIDGLRHHFRSRQEGKPQAMRGPLYMLQL
jgi:hypothetical protein